MAATDLKELCQAILHAQNEVRNNPKCIIPQLKEMIPKFENANSKKYLIRPGCWMNTQEGIPAIKGAIKFCQSQESLPSLDWSDALFYAALDHVDDQGPTNAVGHEGTDGSTPRSRIEKYGTWSGTIAENISYGSESAMEVIIRLIVDDGVPDRGHRTNIFKENIVLCGIAKGFHKKYGSIAVLDYAGEMTSNGITRKEMVKKSAQKLPAFKKTIITTKRTVKKKKAKTKNGGPGISFTVAKNNLANLMGEYDDL